MRIIMIALLVLAPQAIAASLVTDGNGKVTGINELTIEGVNYDVTFTVGSFTAVYGANAFFYEGNSTGATNAVNKIRDFLNEKSVGKITGTEASDILVPFDLAGGCDLNATFTRAAHISNIDTNEWFRYSPLCFAPATDYGNAMTRFAVSANQPPPPVPTPAMPALGLLLLAFGVISLGSLRSRKSRG